jgi:hypothetical protein
MKVQKSKSTKVEKSKSRKRRPATLVLLHSFTFSLLLLGHGARSWADDAKAGAGERGLSVREIQAKLRAKTDIAVDNVPLRDFVSDLSKKHGIAIRLDEQGLQQAGAAPHVPVTANFSDVTVNVALLRILGELGLRHVVKEGEVVITRPPKRVVKIPAPVQEQHVQALRPLFEIELSFVRRVCWPTEDELGHLREDGEKYLADAAATFILGARGQPVRFLGGGVVEVVELQAEAIQGPGLLMRTRPTSDPRRIIRDGLVVSAKARLSPEQAERYRDELEKREAGRKRAMVHCLVAALDRELLLTAAQREKLCESVASNWNAQWDQYLEQTGVTPWQLIPDPPIVPFLEDAQKERFQALRKGPAFGLRFGGAGLNVAAFNIPVDDGRKDIVPDPEE